MNLFPKSAVQLANSLDSVTLRKLGKSALYVTTGSLAAFLLSNVGTFLGAFHVSGQMMVPLAAFLTWLLNLIIEFTKGQAAKDAPTPPTGAGA